MPVVSSLISISRMQYVADLFSSTKKVKKKNNQAVRLQLWPPSLLLLFSQFQRWSFVSNEHRAERQNNRARSLEAGIIKKTTWSWNKWSVFCSPSLYNIYVCVYIYEWLKWVQRCNGWMCTMHTSSRRLSVAGKDDRRMDQGKCEKSTEHVELHTVSRSKWLIRQKVTPHWFSGLSWK